MIGSTKTFSYVYSGLTLEIVATDLGDGKTSFSIKSLVGSADINALYWNDGDNVDDTAGTTGMFGFTGASSENSLNMNGSGEVWDGGIKLSNSGIGPQGNAKPTYLQQGETYPTFTVAVDWDTLDTVGVRATSTTSPGGSIKGVDDTSVVTHPNIGPVATKEIVCVTEDTGPFNGTLLDNASDADGLPDESDLKFALVNPLTKPAGLTLNENGTYTFDTSHQAYQYLNDGESLTFSVDYTVTDADGATATATMCFTVKGTNEAPVCTPHDLATNGNFEVNFEAPEWTQGNIDAGVAYTTVEGWTNTGAVSGPGTGVTTPGGIEVWTQAGLDLRDPNLADAIGNVIETDGLGAGDGDPQSAVKDVYRTTVHAEAGQKVDLSFNYASRGDMGGGTGNDTDSFGIWWNSQQVDADGDATNGMTNFDPSSATAWSTAHLSLTGNASGNNILEIREAGAEDSYGALIDNVQVMTICDAPADTHHNGELKAEWTFENHTQAAGDEVGNPTGFWNLNEWAHNNPQYYPEADDVHAFAGSFQVHGEDGHRALDTAASPGNIFLQASPEGRNGAVLSTNGGVDGGATMPDLVAGQEYHATVKILLQDYLDSPDVVAGWEGTDPDAWVEFNFNGQKLSVYATDGEFDNHHNQFVEFDMVFEGIEGEDYFTIMSHGTGDDNQGLLIDNIAIHDWIV